MKRDWRVPVAIIVVQVVAVGHQDERRNPALEGHKEGRHGTEVALALAELLTPAAAGWNHVS